MSTERDATVLIKLLSPSLGPRAASEKVLATIAKLALDPHKLCEADALRVLDEIANEKGIVGSTARFSRARLMLVWTQE